MRSLDLIDFGDEVGDKEWDSHNMDELHVPVFGDL
jgi:hypothetical protein